MAYKNLFLALALFAGLFLSGCEDKPEDPKPKEVSIALTAPANNATFDLSDVDKITFSWARIEDIAGYALMFALDEAGLGNPAASVTAGNNGAYDLTSEAADIMIAEIAETPPGETVEIYWTVVNTQTPENTIVHTQSRRFTVKRLTVAPEPYLTAAPESLFFTADPEEPQTVDIESNTAWSVEIEQEDDWLTAEPSEGSADGSITFTAARNTGAERTAIVTITGIGAEAVEITVTQEEGEEDEEKEEDEEEEEEAGNGQNNNTATLVEVEATLMTGYDMLRGRAPFAQELAVDWVFGSAASDDAYKGSDVGDQPNFNLVERYEATSNNPYMFDRWRTSYEGVTRANNTLISLKSNPAASNPANEIRSMQIEAEAKYLRAWFHFSANKVFKNIPYIRTPDEQDGKQPLEIPNTDAGWNGIEEDLLWIIDNNALPHRWSGANLGRANIWAAKTLLAQAYMYQNRLQDAKPLLDDIINNGGFSLRPNYYDNFDERTENNSESIFELQASVTGTTHTSMLLTTAVFPQYGPASFGWGFYQPSQSLVEAFQVGSDGLPILDVNQRATVENDMGIWSNFNFTPTDKLLDPRLDWTVARRGIPFLDWGVFAGLYWIREQENGGPYMTKKFIHFNATSGQQTPYRNYNDRNFRYHRLSHVLLWRAEVAVEDGDLALASNLVNLVRNRIKNGHVVMGLVTSTTIGNDGKSQYHGGPPLEIDHTKPAANYSVEPYPAGHIAFDNQANAREAVRMEIRLEFATEGHRFFDLRRWGQSAATPGYDVDVLNRYIADDSEFRSFMTGAAYSAADRYWPIPQSQLDLQPGVLTQSNPSTY